MNNVHVGLIIAAIGLAAAAIIYVPQLQENQQRERDHSGTCILYRTTLELAQVYLDGGKQGEAMKTLGEARELLQKGGCTDILRR